MDKFEIRRMCEIVNSGIQPVQNLRTLGSIQELGGNPKQWARDAIYRGLIVYDECVKKNGGLYSFGDTVTMADVFLVPQLGNARRFHYNFEEDFGHLAVIEKRLMELPEFIKSDKANQITETDPKEDIRL
uniref:GST C-terminal domain-containing protein n=1 Tax=Strombidium rassoulzadegani TaxID=1082188 RepID=A0A7S3G0V7_9SPIT|mmetsp:Transcript_9273/g.15600  ORF Transcript_9273/g.15600 Transcript_9273/m.15600 type:complete len:130 (+) Transcript_9273:425-814(+)